jgi:WD40 repeat protein
MAFSGDGRWLATGDDSAKVYLWDTATGKEVRRLPAGQELVISVAFSPDGKTLAAGVSDNRTLVRLWDVASGDLRWETTVKEGGQPTVTVSPDGRFVAVGSGRVAAKEPCPIHLLDADTGQEVRTLGSHQEHISALAFSPDGKTLASGSFDGMIGLWDVATGKDLRPQAGHGAPVMSLALAPDGKHLASAGRDRTVRLWSLPDGKEQHVLTGHKEMVQAVAFAPDGRSLASVDASEAVCFWDSVSGKEVRRLPGGERRTWIYSFAPDGKSLLGASVNGTVRRRDLATGDELRQYHGIGNNTASSVTFSPDGRTVAGVRQADQQAIRNGATGASEGGVALWDTITGEQKAWIPERESAVSEVAFSPDGRMLAYSCTTGDVQLVDAATGKHRLRLKGHATRSAPLVFSGDGWSVISGSDDRTLRLWEVATGKERLRLSQDVGWPRSLALSRDGRTLYSGGTDNAILVWSLAPPDASRPGKDQLRDKERESVWAELAAEDAGVAYRALCKLLGSGDAAVELLRSRVRSAGAIDAAAVNKLLADLDSDHFEARERAARDLEKLGVAVAPSLRNVLEGTPSAELRRRAQEILTKVEAAGLTANQVREFRALEALERIGTPAARQVLADLAGGVATVPLTLEATAALKRMDRTRAVP